MLANGQNNTVTGISKTDQAIRCARVTMHLRIEVSTEIPWEIRFRRERHARHCAKWRQAEKQPLASLSGLTTTRRALVFGWTQNFHLTEHQLQAASLWP